MVTGFCIVWTNWIDYSVDWFKQEQIPQKFATVNPFPPSISDSFIEVKGDAYGCLNFVPWTPWPLGARQDERRVHQGERILSAKYYLFAGHWNQTTHVCHHDNPLALFPQHQADRWLVVLLLNKTELRDDTVIYKQHSNCFPPPFLPLAAVTQLLSRCCLYQFRSQCIVCQHQFGNSFFTPGHRYTMHWLCCMGEQQGEVGSVQSK